MGAPLSPTYFWGADQVERPKGARKGPNPTQPYPRLYYDAEAAGRAVFLADSEYG